MGELEKGAPPPEQTCDPKAPRGREARGGSVRDLWDPRTINQYWLEAMSHVFDTWMRSQAFLDLMRQGLDMATAFQRGPNLAAPSLEVAPASGPLARQPFQAPPSFPPATTPPRSAPAANDAEPSTREARTEPASASKGKRKIQAKGSK